VRDFARIALIAAALAGGLVALTTWSTPPADLPTAPPAATSRPPAVAEETGSWRPALVPDPRAPRDGADGAVSAQAGSVHFALGRTFLEMGDYYSAASHLAMARQGLGDQGAVCAFLALAYDQLNMTPDLLELLPCLENAAATSQVARDVYDRIRPKVDVEVTFDAAASDHFIASYPAEGVSAGAIGSVLDLLERARRRVEADIGLATARLVPVVVYEGEQFAAATGKPHWVSGLYDGKIRIGVEALYERPEDFETAVAHEYVHALTHEYTDTRLPAWFREGLADNLARSGRSRRDGLTAPLGTTAPMRDIRALADRFIDLSNEEAARAYRQSYWMVNNLVREAGWGAVGALIQDLSADREVPFDAAFADLFGETPADYLDRWLDVAYP